MNLNSNFHTKQRDNCQDSENKSMLDFNDKVKQLLLDIL